MIRSRCENEQKMNHKKFLRKKFEFSRFLLLIRYPPFGKLENQRFCEQKFNDFLYDNDLMFVGKVFPKIIKRNPHPEPSF